jgi:hypothetical protein
MTLFTLALAATVFFSLIFVPIFLADSRREEEHWRVARLTFPSGDAGSEGLQSDTIWRILLTTDW